MKRHIELTDEVRETDAPAPLEFVRLKTVSDELTGVKLKLTSSLVEVANFRWSAHSIAEDASKVEDGLS